LIIKMLFSFLFNTFFLGVVHYRIYTHTNKCFNRGSTFSLGGGYCYASIGTKGSCSWVDSSSDEQGEGGGGGGGGALFPFFFFFFCFHIHINASTRQRINTHQHTHCHVMCCACVSLSDHLILNVCVCVCVCVWVCLLNSITYGGTFLACMSVSHSPMVGASALLLTTQL